MNGFGGRKRGRLQHHRIVAEGHEGTYVLPVVGRAGLGNELFPVMRALTVAATTNARMLHPNWFHPKIGPILRRESDARMYWKLFRRPSAQARLEKILTLARGRIDPTLIRRESGFESLFRPLSQDPAWYRDQFIEMVRPGFISAPLQSKYVSVHVRLGDFSRTAQDAASLAANNHTTPLRWYINVMKSIHRLNPHIEFVISSDGTDHELTPLLQQRLTRRSIANNAADELIILSRSIGIIGSRSTFTAWGAFLGAAPLLLFPGGNAYRPHSDVWESEGLSEAWWESLQQSL